MDEQTVTVTKEQLQALMKDEEGRTLNVSQGRTVADRLWKKLGGHDDPEYLLEKARLALSDGTYGLAVSYFRDLDNALLAGRKLPESWRQAANVLWDSNLTIDHFSDREAESVGGFLAREIARSKSPVLTAGVLKKLLKEYRP